MASLARILAENKDSLTEETINEVITYKDGEWVPVVPTTDETIKTILSRLASLETGLEDRPTEQELGDYDVFMGAYGSSNPD